MVDQLYGCIKSEALKNFLPGYDGVGEKMKAIVMTILKIRVKVMVKVILKVRVLW